MKLYYAPNTCSMADHIALHEAGLVFETERVDLRTKITESGVDFNTINPKGYVPALVLDSGEILSENIAVLDWIAQQGPTLRPVGDLGRSRLLEMLAFISTEIHQQFGTFFSGAGEEQRAEAARAITHRIAYLSEQMDGDYLLGPTAGGADFYLFVMLRWARRRNIPLSEKMLAYLDRVGNLPASRRAMTDEGVT